VPYASPLDEVDGDLADVGRAVGAFDAFLIEPGAGLALNTGAGFAASASFLALFFKLSSLMANRLSRAWFTGVIPARLCASRTPVTGFHKLAT
jgi:hypothetical protein